MSGVCEIGWCSLVVDGEGEGCGRQIMAARYLCSCWGRIVLLSSGGMRWLMFAFGSIRRVHVVWKYSR